MQKLTEYNGVQIVTPDPQDEGGLALNGNFKALSTHIDTVDPAASNDVTQGYSAGSRWFNSTTSDEWICTDPTWGAAVWVEISLLGPQGPQGPQGDIGPQGPQGDIGPQGFQGDPGTQGAQGFQGDPGTPGDTGPQGAQGFQGDPGTPGDTGPQGAQGFQGFQGDPGTPGDTGPQGPQGPIAGAGVYWTYSTSSSGSGYVFTSGGVVYFGTTDGNGNDVTSLLTALTNGSYIRVYDVADPTQQILWELTSDPTTSGATVFFDYTTIETVGTIPNNTYCLFCPTIRGVDGAQGAPGIDGAQGPQGNDGAQGAQGDAGPQGFQGDAGPQGFQGDAGPQGPQGDKTAILPIDGEYLGLFCAEAPQSYFFDVMEVPMGGSYAIDRAFIAACEPGSIRVWAMHCDHGMPGDLQCRVVESRVVIRTAEKERMIRISLLGEKIGTAGRRFPRYSKEQAQSNNRFWAQAHSG